MTGSKQRPDPTAQAFLLTRKGKPGKPQEHYCSAFPALSFFPHGEVRRKAFLYSIRIQKNLKQEVSVLRHLPEDGQQPQSTKQKKAKNQMGNGEVAALELIRQSLYILYNDVPKPD